jgi:hypothetical protein
MVNSPDKTSSRKATAGIYNSDTIPVHNPILKMAVPGRWLLYSSIIRYHTQIMMVLISRGAEKWLQSGNNEVIRI